MTVHGLPTGRIASATVGICLTIGSVLWTLMWGAFALLAVDSDIRSWAVVCGALALVVLALALGIRQRGRFPSTRGWLAWTALFLAPFALQLFQGDDHGASQVSSAVERSYPKRSHVRRANADCAYAAKRADGSEFWACDVETFGPDDLDTCNVHVRRFQPGNIKVRITYCINDDF